MSSTKKTIKTTTRRVSFRRTGSLCRLADTKRIPMAERTDVDAARVRCPLHAEPSVQRLQSIFQSLLIIWRSLRQDQLVALQSIFTAEQLLPLVEQVRQHFEEEAKAERRGRAA